MADFNLVKNVLVSYRGRKRPVSFCSEPSDERKSLVAAIGDTFKDVVNDGFSDDVVVQMKSEDWGGEFVDVPKDAVIPDRAVLQIITEVSLVVGVKARVCTNNNIIIMDLSLES